MDTRFALLLACFFLSGFAALLYQTVWTRELSFVFGTSELAIAAVLAAYMGGLALGAAAAARYVTRMRRPVLAYGVLELATAVSALLVPVGIRLTNSVYVGLLRGGDELPEAEATAAALFQLGTAFAVLLPPTAFMGATLPVLAHYAVRNEAEIGRRVGVLYAVNTAGAIVGTLCAAFWLMPELGLRHTVWVGVALNGLVFALAACLAPGTMKPETANRMRPAPKPVAGGAAWILPAVAVSGAVSFAYEVLWTRLLGQLLGASLDAFATMLASFLLGIALGSAFASRLATSRERAAVGFGVAQLGIALTSYLGFAFADWLPELSLVVGAGAGAPLASAAVAGAVLLPITLCIGATFPFAVRVLALSPEQAAGATARVYAWNTLGAIAGALGAGFVLLPGLGFAGTIAAGAIANLGLGAIAAVSIRPRRTALAIATATAALVLIARPPHTPWALLSSSPLSRQRSQGEIVYAAVGRSSTVMLFDQTTQFRLTSNGLPESIIERAGMLPQPSIGYWMGLLPSLLRPDARDLLVIGLGGGRALEPIPSSIASIDVIEIEREILTANQRAAPERNIDPLEDSRVRVHIGDARGLLQLTERRFDAVVSQPSHPWTAGASHLYTREFFALVRSRLQPDGVFAQWIGLSFVDAALLRSLAATLVDVFGNVEVYQPAGSSGLLFAASVEPFASLESARRALQATPEDYGRFGIHRVEDFAAVRVLDSVGTRALSEGGSLITDDHNLLASRASRLGNSALNVNSVRRLWDDLDPLLTGIDGLDQSALLRKLVATGFEERAFALAMSQEPALDEAGLGWVELGLARPGRAARHFERALELAPDMSDAVVGLVASLPLTIAQASAAAGISQQDLDEQLAALISGRRHEVSGDWDSVATLDAELGRILPGEALFVEASRLRARWRLTAGDPTAGAEALVIAETLLSRKWEAGDSLLRATAALATDQPSVVWGSLRRIADTANLPVVVYARALEIAEALPEDRDRDLRVLLQSRRSRAARSGH